MRRFLPQPRLTVALWALWLLLVNSVAPGAILLGLVLGVAIPLLTAPFWPDPPRLRHPGRILAYLGVVLWDIAVANVQVAKLILTRRNSELRPTFLTVPLELTTAEAIGVLAGTITLTPGTVSCDLSADGKALLVHALDCTDPAAAVADIKERYERRLLEIFA